METWHISFKFWLNHVGYRPKHKWTRKLSAGALDFFIEKIVYMNLDQNNQPISNQISMVQVHLNQIYDLYDVNSDNFRVHLCVGL